MRCVLRERILRNRLILTDHLLQSLGFVQNPELSTVAAFLIPPDGEYVFTALNETHIRDNRNKGPLYRLKDRQSFVVRVGPQSKALTVFSREAPGDNPWLTTFENSE